MQLAKVMVALVLAVAFIAGGFALHLHFDTERKIIEALETGHAVISVHERTDWRHANEICFDVTIQIEDFDPERKSLMVYGDDDGGTWVLSRVEYRSMAECEADFRRE